MKPGQFRTGEVCNNPYPNTKILEQNGLYFRHISRLCLQPFTRLLSGLCLLFGVLQSPDVSAIEDSSNNDHWLFALFSFDKGSIDTEVLMTALRSYDHDVFEFLYTSGFLTERINKKIRVERNKIACVIARQSPDDGQAKESDGGIGVCFTPFTESSLSIKKQQGHETEASSEASFEYSVLGQMVRSMCWDKHDDYFGQTFRYPDDCQQRNNNDGPAKPPSTHSYPEAVDVVHSFASARHAFSALGASELTDYSLLLKETDLPQPDMANRLKYDDGQSVRRILMPPQVVSVYPSQRTAPTTANGSSRTRVQHGQTLTQIRDTLRSGSGATAPVLSGAVPPRYWNQHTAQGATAAQPPAAQAPDANVRGALPEINDEYVDRFTDQVDAFLGGDWNEDTAIRHLNELERISNFSREEEENGRPGIDFMMQAWVRHLIEQIQSRGFERHSASINQVHGSAQRQLFEGNADLAQLNQIEQALSGVTSQVQRYASANHQSHQADWELEVKKQKTSQQAQISRMRVTEILDNSEDENYLYQQITPPTIRALNFRLNELLDETSGTMSPNRQEIVLRDFRGLARISQLVHEHRERFHALKKITQPASQQELDDFRACADQLPRYIRQLEHEINPAEFSLNQQRLEELKRLNLDQQLDAAVASSMSEDDYQAIIRVLSGESLTPEQRQRASFSTTLGDRPLTYRGHSRTYVVYESETATSIRQNQPDGTTLELAHGSYEFVRRIITLAGGLQKVTRQHVIQVLREGDYDRGKR